MGYSHGYSFRTKRKALAAKKKIEKSYMKSHGKKPEVYLEDYGRLGVGGRWVVRDFGVLKDPPKKPRWKFW